jgi:hypothetical protein
MGGSDDHDWSFMRNQPRDTRDEVERRLWREESRKRRVEAGARRRREREEDEAVVRAELERRFLREFGEHPWIDDPSVCASAFADFEREHREAVVRDLNREAE